MKILKMASHLVLVALALVLCASVGRSQVMTGKFTLPVEVRWGGTTLPAGDYTLQVDSVSVPKFIRVDGERKSALILVGSHDPSPNPDHSQLLLVETGQGYAVQSFEVGGDYGVNLGFVVSNPKATEYASNRKTPGNMEVPVRGGH